MYQDENKPLETLIDRLQAEHHLEMMRLMADDGHRVGGRLQNMVRTFLKVYMEIGSYFLFLQEQIKDIIIISVSRGKALWVAD
jgi:hypothetical protein